MATMSQLQMPLVAIVLLVSVFRLTLLFAAVQSATAENSGRQPATQSLLCDEACIATHLNFWVGKTCRHYFAAGRGQEGQLHHDV